MDEQPVEQENSERWVVTFADIITLLLCFFIMLWSAAVLDHDKFTRMASSARVQFGMEPPKAPVASAPGDGAASGPGILMGQLMGALEGALGPEVWEHVHLLYGPESVTVRILTRDVFFKPGSAELEPKLRQVLTQVSKVLREGTNPVRIEGHTCDLPPRVGYASNWELSAQRAVNVLSYFAHYQRIAPDRLTAAAYADRRPLEPNTSETARERNRRVDIVLLEAVGASRPHDALPETTAIGQIGPPPPDLVPDVDLRP